MAEPIDPKELKQLLLTGQTGAGLKESDIQNETDLFAAGLLDSLEVLSFVEELERKFKVLVDPSDITIKNFKSLSTIQALVNKIRA